MNRHSRIILFLLVVFSVAFLAFNLVPEKQYYPWSDEGYYYRYGSQIEQEGLPGLKKLLSWYAGDEKARYHPAPTRIGYLFIVSILFRIFGPSYVLLGLISFVSFLCFLWISFYFIKKYVDEAAAWHATALLSSSPLLLAMSRRALTDSMINLSWALSFWLFFDFLHPPTQDAAPLKNGAEERESGIVSASADVRPFLEKGTTSVVGLHKPQAKKYFFLIASLAWALLVKEASVILLPLFAFFFLVERKYFNLAVPRIYFWGILLGPIAIAGPCFFVALGGWENIFVAIKAILSTHFDPHYSNQYATVFCVGPWYRYLVDFLLLSPCMMLLFLGQFFWLLLEKKKTLMERYLLFYCVSIFVFFSSLSHTKVVRFVISLEMVIALFAFFYILKISKKVGEGHAAKITLLIIIFLFTTNWLNFYSIFFKTGLLDPISFHLLRTMQFIP